MIALKNHTQTMRTLHRTWKRRIFRQTFSLLLLHCPLLMHKLGIQSFRVIIKGNYHFTFSKDSPFKVQ